MPTTAATAKASAEAPPIPAIAAGTMMNTLEAGVTADSVMRMFSRNVSERERSCVYFAAVGGDSSDRSIGSTAARGDRLGSRGGRCRGQVLVHGCPSLRTRVCTADVGAPGGSRDRTALEAIRDRGIARVRIRDVADLAGVATGTVHYYFDDLDRLMHEVHSRAADRFYDERVAAISGCDDAREKLGRMLSSGLPTSRDDAIVVALYELGVYKRGDPVHSLLSSGLYDRQVALYFGVLELGQSQGHFRVGPEPAIDVARNLVALEDADGLHIIDDNRSLPPERCATLIAGYARTATGCAEIPLTVARDAPG